MLEIANSGTAQAPIRFLAEPGEEVVLTGKGGALRGIQFVERNGNIPRFVEVNGFIVRDFDEVGVLMKGVSDITVRNIEVTDCRLGAIGAHYSARITVEGCEVHHNAMTGWTSAINLWLCQDGNVVRGNRVWANTDEDPRESEGHGIILDYCETWGSTLIENNVIWENEGYCMAVLYSDNATIRNNTCYLNALNRYDGTGELSVRGKNTAIHNNVFVSRYNCPALKIQDDVDINQISSDYNILWSPYHQNVAEWPVWKRGNLATYRQNTGNRLDTHSQQINPQFVDPSQAIFELQPASPAIDRGDNSKASPTDILAVARPVDGDNNGAAVVDLGAFEHAAGSIFSQSFESGSFAGWIVVSN